MKITIESDDDIESFTWTATYKSKDIILAKLKVKEQLLNHQTEKVTVTTTTTNKLTGKKVKDSDTMTEEIPKEMLMSY